MYREGQLHLIPTAWLKMIQTEKTSADPSSSLPDSITRTKKSNMFKFAVCDLASGANQYDWKCALATSRGS